MSESEKYHLAIETLSKSPGRLGGIAATLSSLLQEEDALAERKVFKRNVAHTLRDNCNQVEAYLDELGLRRLTFLGHGANAMALDSASHQVVRIAQGSERPRLVSDMILQPLLSIQLDSGYRVEVLPKVRTEGVTDTHVKILQIALANCEPPLHLLNPSKYNVGLLQDGTPVVIDAGAVIVAGSEPLKKSHVPLIAKDTPLPELSAEESYGWDGKWANKQEKHMRTLGLRKGGLVNVISGQELAALDARPGNEELVATIQNGAYLDELPLPARLRLTMSANAQSGDGTPPL